MRRLSLLLFTAFVAASGCTSARLPCKPTVPAPGLLDIVGTDPYADYRAMIGEVLSERFSLDDKTVVVDMLALSAGGQWGAFGAGFLNGWAAKDKQRIIERPDFEVVTGVSTGALIATFAFLGTADDDKVLEYEYTNIDKNDIYKLRSPLAIPFSNSLLKTDRLRKRLRNRIEPGLLQRVADTNGRVLSVLTENFDKGRPQPIDLVAIAKSSDSKRREHYVDALMAAAAIPIAFPPVFIGCQMLVDGGAREAVFIHETLRGSKNSYGSVLAAGPSRRA